MIHDFCEVLKVFPTLLYSREDFILCSDNAIQKLALIYSIINF